MIYQESSLSKELSVAENIFCGRLPRRGPFVDWNQLYEKTQATLARFNANLSPRTLVKDLSPAQCKIVEIAKALSMSAQLIVFDEPTAALTKSETQTLFQVMQSLKRDGISIIFITHRLAEIFQIADRITILRDGVWVTTADTAGLTEEKIILNMVGRSVQHQYLRPELPLKQPLLETRGLSGTGFTGISLRVQTGEIVGLFGLVGSGRTEFVRALFGADRHTGGVVLVENQPCNFTTPSEAIRAGVVLAPEDHKSQGLVLGMSVRNNISLPSLLSLSRFQFIQARKENDLAETYRTKLDIRCPSIATPAISLSGGNQQKVVIAKWLAKQPKVLIVDEPTRGIDVRAKAEVYNLMLTLAEQGMGILMVSSELPEILGICDRIYVMHEGKLAGEVSRKEASEELLMTYASGQSAITV
jgi:ABC-type sugar transport system ATPase subunit